MHFYTILYNIIQHNILVANNEMQKQNINNNSGNAAISEITNSSIGNNNNKDKHSNQYRRINYMIFKCDTCHTVYQIKHVCVCI